MRLIDADELKTAFPVCDNSKPVLIASVRAAINHMPTIEPVRKGHKINQHSYPAKWLCSECGAKHFDFGDKFCSKCGANVEEGEADADTEV